MVQRNFTPEPQHARCPSGVTDWIRLHCQKNMQKPRASHIIMNEHKVCLRAHPTLCMWPIVHANCDVSSPSVEASFHGNTSLWEQGCRRDGGAEPRWPSRRRARRVCSLGRAGLVHRGSNAEHNWTATMWWGSNELVKTLCGNAVLPHQLLMDFSVVSESESTGISNTM